MSDDTTVQGAPENVYAKPTEIGSSFESAERVKLFSRRTGLDALGMTQEFDDRCRKVDEEVRAKFYRGDEEGYKQYLARMAAGRARTHDNLLRIEKAEYLKGDMMRRESMFAADVEATTQGVVTDSAATKAERGIVLDEAQRQYKGIVEELGGDEEYLKSIMKANEETVIEDEATRERAAKFAAAYGRLAAAMYASNDFGRAHAHENVVPRLRQWAREKHQEWYDYYMKRGWDSDSAYAGASQKVTAGSASILSSIGNSGDDELLRYVLEELGSPDARRVRMVNEKGVPLVSVDKDGKETPLYDDSKFDPSGSMFLTPDKITELTDGLNRRVAARERIQHKQAQMEQQALEEEGFRTANVIEAQFQDELGKGDPDPVKVEAWRDALFQLTKNGSKAVSNHARELRDKIDSMIRADERLKAKAVDKATRLQTKEDFQKEYDNYVAFWNSQALFDAVEQNKNGLLVESKEMPMVQMDGKKRLMILINNGMNRGILTEAVWARRLKEAEEGHTADNMREARLAIAGIDGLSLDESLNKKQRRAAGRYGKREDLDPAVAEMYFDPSSNKLKANAKSGLIYKRDDGIDVHLNADQINVLMQKVAEFQRRHVNPSVEDARRYAIDVLDEATEKYEAGWLWNKHTEGKITDITSSADKVAKVYFDKYSTRDYGAAAKFFEAKPLSMFSNPNEDLLDRMRKARVAQAAEAKKEGGAK